MPVNNPGGGSGGPHSIESHQDVVLPPRHQEALSYEVSAVDPVDRQEDFSDEENPVFPFVTSGGWEALWDDEYFRVVNGLGLSAVNDITFTLDIPDDASGLRVSLEFGTDNGGTHYRTITVFVDGDVDNKTILYVEGYADIYKSGWFALDEGRETLTVRYVSDLAGSPGVEEVFLNAFDLKYDVPAEGATGEWETHSVARRMHRHSYDEIDGTPLTLPPQVAGTPSEGDVIKYVSGVPTWAAP